MKRLLIGFVAGVCLAVGVVALLQRSDTQQPQGARPPAPVETKVGQDVADSPEPAPGAIVFDMKYRSLGGGIDEMRYDSYWGFGQSGGSDTTFIKDVRKRADGVETVNNRYFSGAEWAAVEIKDKEAIAFYFDLDANGKLSDDEKILPTQTQNSTSSSQTEFVTPDFVMKTREGNKVPFRARLQVAFYGSSSRPQCMWSPSCVLEGTSTIAGEPTRLILFTNGFSGSFKEFGRGSYSLLPPDEQTGRYIPRESLSSLVNHKGQYYRLKLHGNHEENKAMRASLAKYTGATGEIAVKLTGNSDLTAKLSSASLISTNDATIRFNMSEDQSTLPVEAYELTRGYINYGVKSSNQYRVNFTEGPEFKIDADETDTVELGKPELSVWAVEETKRNRSDVKEQSVYAEGTNIYLQTKIRGKAGELYGKFSQRAGKHSNYEDVEPTIRIVDSKGKEVASATMEYG